MEEIKTEIPPTIEKVADEEETKKSTPWKFVYLVLAIVVIFMAILAYYPLKNHFFPPTGAVVTVNDLFLKNLNGELPEEQGYMYNHYSFILFDGLWYTEVQYENKNFQVPLHFGPRDLEDVPMNGSLDERFEQDQVYLSFNPLDSDDYIGAALGELSQNLAMVIHRQPIAACDRNETDACLERPIVDCSDTDKAVILIVQDKGPKIELKGNCVVLQGREDELLKATDRMILLWYKIMPLESS